MKKGLKRIVSSVLAAAMVLTSGIMSTAAFADTATVETGDWDVRYGDNYTAAPASGDTVYTEDGVSVIAASALTYAEVTGDTFATGGDRTYKGYVKTPGSTCNQTITADGEKVTSFRIAFEITNTSANDAVINIDHKVGSTKTNYILGDYDASAGTATVVDSAYNSGSSSTYETFAITLGAGETVYVAGRGSDICIYGINVAVSESSSSGGSSSGSSTVEPTVETGDWDVRYGDNYTAAPASGDTVYTEDGVSVIAASALTYAEVTGDTFATGGDRTYKGYVKTPGSTCNQTITADGEKVTSFRIAFEITNTSANDAVINIDHKVGSTKTNYILGDYDASAGTATVVDSAYNSGSSSTYETFVLTLGAGETVYVAGRGSDICIYGINIAVASASSGTLTTTEVEADTDGVTYYVLSLVSEDDVDSYSTVTQETDSTTIATSDTVYTGVSYNGYTYTAPDGYYVFASIVDASTTSDDASTVLANVQTIESYLN